jgi:hypothetical protein
LVEHDWPDDPSRDEGVSAMSYYEEDDPEADDCPESSDGFADEFEESGYSEDECFRIEDGERVWPHPQSDGSVEWHSDSHTGDGYCQGCDCGAKDPDDCEGDE